jgi:hypothetical protein
MRHCYGQDTGRLLERLLSNVLIAAGQLGIDKARQAME